MYYLWTVTSMRGNEMAVVARTYGDAVSMAWTAFSCLESYQAEANPFHHLNVEKVERGPSIDYVPALLKPYNVVAED